MRFLCLVLAASTAAAQTPSEKNAAPLYREAFGKMVAFPEDLDLPARQALSGEALWDEAKLGTYVDANQEALELMRRGTKLPGCSFELDFSLGAGMPLEHLPKLRSLARMNAIDGARNLAQFRGAVAADAWLTGLRFAVHAAQDGTLISGLVGCSIFTMNVEPLLRAAGEGKFDAEVLGRIEREVSAIPAYGFDWANVMDGERRCGEAQFDSMLKQKDSLAYMQMLEELGDMKDDRVKKLQEKLKDKDPESAKKAAAEAKKLFETWRDEYSALMKEISAAFAKPWKESQALLDPILDRKINPMVELLMGAVVSANQTRGRMEAQRAGLIAVAALLRHCESGGDLPGSLKGLDVPSDPFTGGPLQVELTTEGAEIRSEGKTADGKPIVFRIKSR
ncbi:MAG: hypothetical protein HYY18_17170 [Planctomycetes bacterium]|nr:hypothetical protein [Planctomycetota bacterium]